MKNLALLLLVSFIARALGEENPKPLYRVHAHNDYEHEHPLWDALGHGFTSVEADIYLVEGKLLVAHDRRNVQATNTLEALYLDPLAKLAKEHGGRIYHDWPSEVLLIDVKSQAEPTYVALDKVLQKYADMLTRFEGSSIHTNAVTVIISGNRARKAMLAQQSRWAAYDGRLSDLGTAASPAFIPLISDSWDTRFKWNGTGPFPEDESRKLKEIVAKVHGEKRVLRLWAAPDEESAWKELYDAGVDMINTDHLAALENFLREHQTSSK